jgi:hypothetical protein
MVQSVGEVFSLSGKIQRKLLKNGNKDDTKISQEDVPLFEKLGGLELNSVSIQYMTVSHIYALLWSKWKKNLRVEQRMSTLDIILRSSPTHWWDTQKSNLPSWEDINLCLASSIYPSFPS